MSLSVLVADDDADICQLLQMDFELMGFAVHTARNGQEALAHLQSPTAFDVVLLDVMMPKLDGYSVCQRLRQLPQHEATPVILLTAKGLLADKVKGFHAGADDYLVKPFEFQELMVRMRALLRRNGKLAELKAASQRASGGGLAPALVKKTEPKAHECLRFGPLELVPSALEVRVEGVLKRLTPTEFELLYCLMQHVNQPVPLATLLKEVWGYEPDEDVRIIRVHMGSLRQKLEPDPKAPVWLQTVNNVGYRLVLPLPQEEATG
jgi:DNA-binding response OmpR family regulator